MNKWERRSGGIGPLGQKIAQVDVSEQTKWVVDPDNSPGNARVCYARHPEHAVKRFVVGDASEEMLPPDWHNSFVKGVVLHGNTYSVYGPFHGVPSYK